jgi:hypothetical protein
VRVLRNRGEIRKCGVHAILREKFEIFDFLSFCKVIGLSPCKD